MAEIIERDCAWRAGTQKTWWRELTGGQQNELWRGQTIRREGDGPSIMVQDIGESDERAGKLVVFTCCDESGAKAAYPTIEALWREPAAKVRALIRTAQEARAHFEGDEGNG